MFSVPAILSLLGRVPAALWLVAALGGWGLWGHHQANALRGAKAAEHIAAVESGRQAEHLANLSNKTVGDNLVNDTKTRGGRTAAAARRLRDVAATKPAGPAAGATCGSDAPPVLVLRDETREHLVELADDADATADALRACQAYVRDVVKPEF